MQVRCSVCRLPNPLRTSVETGLGDGTLPFRQARRLTGIALSTLYRHKVGHWKPPGRELPELAPAGGAPPATISTEPFQYPCVSEVVDQAAIARVRAQKWPKDHNIVAYLASLSRPRTQKPPDSVPDLSEQEWERLIAQLDSEV